MSLSVGLFDGDLALWSDSRALVLTGGVWREAEAFKMWDGARINVDRAFMRKLIAEAPPPPDAGFARNLAEMAGQ